MKKFSKKKFKLQRDSSKSILKQKKTKDNKNIAENVKSDLEAKREYNRVKKREQRIRDKKRNSKNFQFRCNDELMKKIEKEAKILNISKSEFVRKAINEYTRS